MKSYSAYFVTTGNIDVVKKALGAPVEIPGSPWLLCGYRPDASPPDDDVLLGNASLVQRKSETLGEIIYLFSDRSPASLVYEHAREGKLLRKLVWFPMLDDDWTPGWLCAQGEQESWEDALFRPDALQRAIENERDAYRDRGEASLFPRREAELRAYFEKRVIIAPGTWPECSGDAALLVERHFGLSRPAKP